MALPEIANEDSISDLAVRQNPEAFRSPRAVMNFHGVLILCVVMVGLTAIFFLAAQ